MKVTVVVMTRDSGDLDEGDSDGMQRGPREAELAGGLGVCSGRGGDQECCLERSAQDASCTASWGPSEHLGKVREPEGGWVETGA